MPGCIDRLTFGSADNESENQVNSFLLFSSPRETPLHFWLREEEEREEGC